MRPELLTLYGGPADHGLRFGRGRCGRFAVDVLEQGTGDLRHIDRLFSACSIFREPLHEGQ